MENLNRMTERELIGFFSDFHKDLLGCRPSFMPQGREELIAAIHNAFDLLNCMKANGDLDETWS